MLSLNNFWDTIQVSKTQRFKKDPQKKSNLTQQQLIARQNFVWKSFSLSMFSIDNKSDTLRMALGNCESDPAPGRWLETAHLKMTMSSYGSNNKVYTPTCAAKSSPERGFSVLKCFASTILLAFTTLFPRLSSKPGHAPTRSPVRLNFHDLKSCNNPDTRRRIKQRNKGELKVKLHSLTASHSRPLL